MTYEMELLVRHNDGIREGIAIGREEGLAVGRKEGLSQGLKQGQAAGRKEGFYQTALSMLKKGLPVQLISECTSLTEQEVLNLAKEHNLL